MNEWGGAWEDVGRREGKRSAGPSLSPHYISHILEGADGARNGGATHEPTPLRLAGGHGHDDASQRGCGATQPASAICSLDDLCEPWAAAGRTANGMGLLVRQGSEGMGSGELS